MLQQEGYLDILSFPTSYLNWPHRLIVSSQSYCRDITEYSYFFASLNLEHCLKSSLDVHVIKINFKLTQHLNTSYSLRFLNVFYFQNSITFQQPVLGPQNALQWGRKKINQHLKKSNTIDIHFLWDLFIYRPLKTGLQRDFISYSHLGLELSAEFCQSRRKSYKWFSKC